MEPLLAEYLARVKILHREFVATFEGLPAKALDWVPGEAMNSFAILVVHIAGSMRFWVGDVALDDPSNRQRDLEFQTKGLSEAELKARLSALEDYLSAKFETLTMADLAATHDVPARGETWTGYGALLHAVSHTGVHLGHAQITRQLWDRR